MNILEFSFIFWVFLCHIYFYGRYYAKDASYVLCLIALTMIANKAMASSQRYGGCKFIHNNLFLSMDGWKDLPF